MLNLIFLTMRMSKTYTLVFLPCLFLCKSHPVRVRVICQNDRTRVLISCFHSKVLKIIIIIIIPLVLSDKRIVSLKRKMKAEWCLTKNLKPPLNHLHGFLLLSHSTHHCILTSFLPRQSSLLLDLGI